MIVDVDGLIAPCLQSPNTFDNKHDQLNVVFSEQTTICQRTGFRAQNKEGQTKDTKHVFLLPPLYNSAVACCAVHYDIELDVQCHYTEGGCAFDRGVRWMLARPNIIIIARSSWHMTRPASANRQEPISIKVTAHLACHLTTARFEINCNGMRYRIVKHVLFFLI